MLHPTTCAVYPSECSATPSFLEGDFQAKSPASAELNDAPYLAPFALRKKERIYQERPK